MTPELFDAARSRLAMTGFDAQMQTRISIFLGATKNINVALMGAAALLPITNVSQAFAHSQLFREVEAASLLARVTRWSMHWQVYAEAARLCAPLWAELARCRGFAVPTMDRRAAFNRLALSHALLARVRVAPIIPQRADELDPYVVALRRIEADSGRLIQLQIRLLQHAAQTNVVDDADVIVERAQQVIDDAYSAFLDSLASR
jgi:hypothetical protein